MLCSIVELCSNIGFTFQAMRGVMRGDQANLFVVVTKPRQERIALENLHRQGYECFLPMAENPYQRRRNNHQQIIEPLFPRYLF